ncbi:hypothetical protein [Streptomyces sp. AK04-3B]|uniref:hypothetical protein n=1 Tax=unclassified Streptomyces TaxID=2593676 RepID=UPI0029A39F3E|nr:hypothetical protein [Streptomyces sp. AK04-3B]MDX3798832.1 hypothetical protein [Streptomyces sp. AK04-3B]
MRKTTEAIVGAITVPWTTPSGLLLGRLTFYIEGPDGLEPLWFWLNQQGLPSRPVSWGSVFPCGE